MTAVRERLTAALADRYRSERELGAGGMATVYLAHDLKPDRLVAIKVLRPELSAVIGAERFLREIKTIAGLQHPHILGLIDSGEMDGTARSRVARVRAGGSVVEVIGRLDSAGFVAEQDWVQGLGWSAGGGAELRC